MLEGLKSAVVAVFSGDKEQAKKTRAKKPPKPPKIKPPKTAGKLAGKAASGTTRHSGAQAEDCACAWLSGRGFEILERNFSAKCGEIDIIARRGEILHFIEVKSGIGEPVFKITPKKLDNLARTIDIYRAANRELAGLNYTLSALILTKKTTSDESFAIEWLENITLF